MKLNIIDGIILTIAGAIFVSLSLDVYSTNWSGLIIGALVMLLGLYSATYDLWRN